MTKWSAQVQRLLRDLELQGLTVTRHDRRQQRDRNNSNYVLHQTYLKRLAERIGTLNLAQINPDNAQGVELERVCVCRFAHRIKPERGSAELAGSGLVDQ